MQVEVVASNGSVDEVLGERENRRVRERRVKPRSDVGERADCRLQVFQILDQVGLSVVDQPGGGVAEHPQVIQSGGQAGPLLDKYLERGRYLAQRLGENVALSCECLGKPVQRLDRRNDVVPLLVQCPHESVEPIKQIANSSLAPGQRGAEIVD